MRTIKFIHNHQEFEIRVISDGNTIYVKAFKDGLPANGYSYQVSLPVAFDMDRLLGMSAVDDLIENAKDDVVNGTWEKLLEAMKSLKSGSNQI